ncbi:hypothetical protein L6E12_29725 [Actinokineospora sp. PR83]|uniref:DUF6801 domain-containing protein n=1 Tax=Actinokineospora sp. PR83 TaxID=2884908 RepID=UPI001F30DE18|nr:DUF6801 domain-containing protein [Actinokineospora sp. PR83]MCG8919958.1 hypothetical protein [Actinokineospora sp. PR83]
MEITRSGGSSSCAVDLPGLPRIETSMGVTVTMSVPDTAVVNQPTAPIPWRASGSIGLDLSEKSPLTAYLMANGAASVSISASTSLLYYRVGGEPHSLSFATTTPLPAASTLVEGAGELPPFLFTTVGQGQTAIYHSSSWVSVTPLKADGSPLPIDDLPSFCLGSPWFEPWHTVDVLPGPTSADYAVTARAGVAGTEVDLGAGSLALTEAVDKSVTGSLDLPGSGTTELRLLGVIPATASVRVTPGPVTGSFADGFTAPATVTVANLSILGIPLLRDQNTCQSTTTLALTAGDGLAIDHSGSLTGSYDLPAFTGCGFYTDLVSSLFSRNGNTITATTD